MFGKSALQIWLVILLGVLFPGVELHADDIRFFGDWSYITSLVETEYQDGSVDDKTETERFKQNYRLDVSKELFPNLNLNAGSQMESSRQFNDINDDETSFRDFSVLPYVEAELRTSLYSLSGGYRERYEKTRGSDIETERTYTDSYTLRGEWRPVDLPRVDLSYQHVKRHDKPFEQGNQTSVFQLNSRYDYQNYEFRYGYFHNDDQIQQDTGETLGTITGTHNGRVRYSNSYLDGQLTLNAALRGEYTNQSFSGSGIRDFSVNPTGDSFYYLDPDLSPHNNSSSDYTIASDFAEILNLKTTGTLDVGLSFGEPVEVDMLQLTLSAELDTNTTITNLANWTVYVSRDQTIWTPRTVTAVDYFRDENRLEIRFTPRAEYDYILLVYHPLLNTNQIQPVYISSIRAFVSQLLTDGSEMTTHAINTQLGLGWSLSDKTNLIYDFSIQERQSSLFDDQRVRLNNSLTLVRHINDMFTATGRVSSSDSWEQGQHDASRYSYSAKLNARYLDTLSQALIYSGGWNQEQEGDSTTNSLLLHTNAELYRGWDVAFDQGYSWQSPIDGADSSSFFVRIENSLVPHRRFNLYADYAITWEKQIGAELIRTDSGRLRASWIPSDTLSLRGEVQLRINQGSTDVFWEYGVSWLPLRDGSLQCNLSYSEEEDADGYRTRSLSPNLSWDMTDYANLSLRYSQGTDESSSKTDTFRTLLVNLKIYYD